ncbi:glutaminase [Marichromatium purpuratum 984]|uniref:glutaminase n=1 Tax=Marichromatium purpuratum 984 TaxID=765910 RepID=W0E150_MARPU|nr:glutaminase [Marichromatium purpuratum]AHF03233.1 glutaminase [Marichromatium purpuratum 984]
MRALSALVLALLLGGCAAPTQPPATSETIPAPSAPTPAQPRLAADLRAVAADLRDNHDGEVYAGAVAGTRAEDLAIALTLVDGRTLEVGRTDTRFPLMSVSKPFTYALALEQRGAGFMRARIGTNATGLPYNSLAAGAIRPSTAQNPLVNAGAIATHSYLRGPDPATKRARLLEFYARLAGRPLAIESAWRATPRAQTYALAYQMQAAERLEGEVEDAVSRYLEACIVAVDVAALAHMGATLANAGIAPGGDERIITAAHARDVLALMTIAGMYEDSGRWWQRVGLPAKSGVSGAILAVVPGWGAIAAYSPRLDAAGNSVRAALAIEQLATRWRLHGVERLLAAPAR